MYGFAQATQTALDCVYSGCVTDFGDATRCRRIRHVGDGADPGRVATPLSVNRNRDELTGHISRCATAFAEIADGGYRDVLAIGKKTLARIHRTVTESSLK